MVFQISTIDVVAAAVVVVMFFPFGSFNKAKIKKVTGLPILKRFVN